MKKRWAAAGSKSIGAQERCEGGATAKWRGTGQKPRPLRPNAAAAQCLHNLVDGDIMEMNLAPSFLGRVSQREHKDDYRAGFQICNGGRHGEGTGCVEDQAEVAAAVSGVRAIEG